MDKSEQIHYIYSPVFSNLEDAVESLRQGCHCRQWNIIKRV